MGKWGQGLKIYLGATKQRTVLFNLAQEFYPAHPSSSRKNSLSQHFFTILLHSRWTNVHFMGKWGQGLKIDRWATKQRTVLFNLAQEFYPAHPSSSRKNSLSQHFFTVLLHSSWTNVHFMGKWRQGLETASGQQSSGQYFLTLYKNFTQLGHPLQEKIRLVCICSQFCFIPGEHMSTLWTNGHRCLKSTWGQQSSGQYFLTLYNNFTQLGHPLQEKIRFVCIFSQFCFIPGVQMSTLRTNGHRGLKSTWWLQSSGQYSLTSHKKFTQLSHPLQGKIR